jgi:hypothetical protein
MHGDPQFQYPSESLPADDPELGMVHADADAFLEFETAVCSECEECAGCQGACRDGLWDQHAVCGC